jgi:hypothetical protein
LFDEAEIHLLLESVHFGDLDDDFIAETNDAAVATPDEVIARGVEHVKIVLQC